MSSPSIQSTLFQPTEFRREHDGNVSYRDPQGTWRLLPPLNGLPQTPSVALPAAATNPYSIQNSNQRLGPTHAPTIAHARGLKKAEKVASTRQKGKKRKLASSDSEGVAAAPKRGRPSGLGNYTMDDLTKLLDLVEDELPIGQKGWKVIHRAYTKWAKANARPLRVEKALENKFKQRAHEIEDLINEKAGTRDVSDSKLGDASGQSSDEDVKVIEPRTNTLDIFSKFTESLDPKHARARDESRAQRSFETAQFLSLSQQLEALRAQVTALQSENFDLKRARDRAEMELRFGGIGRAYSRERRTYSRGRSRSRINSRVRSHLRGRSHHRPSHRSSGRDLSGLQRVRGKIRCEKRFPDGGAMTYWVTDASSDASDFDYRDKHRRTPTPGPSRRRRTPTPGPSRRRNTPTPDPSPHRTSSPALSRYHRSPSTGPSRHITGTAVASAVTGNAVELVVTPQRGHPTSFIISPTATRANN
ncbi:hypothetical protein GGX14DRAFT_387325 [Mycena pura]|uniref:Uncharacterized protein n=1 Tax=Mycena pura TaxID=153505 RepID=A0AAD6YNN7_9AGAR|nr:hypothetical protein GGX14DRAFT_387325 [Mycena pura]